VTKNATFAATETSGQKMTEKAAAKMKNMTAIGMELERRLTGIDLLSEELLSFQSWRDVLLVKR
jgi:hypothetical protein